MNPEKINAISYLLRVYAKVKGIASPTCEFKVGYVTYTWNKTTFCLIVDVFESDIEIYLYNINSTAPAVNYWVLPGEYKRYDENNIPIGIYHLFL